MGKEARHVFSYQGEGGSSIHPRYSSSSSSKSGTGGRRSSRSRRRGRERSARRSSAVRLRTEAVEFGDGAVDHGGNDVAVELVAFEEIGDAEDEEFAVEVVFEAAEGELLVGAREQFEGEGTAALVEGHGGFGHDGEGIEFGEGLGEEVDVGVVGLEAGLDDLAALDLLALPALVAEGVLDGLELDGRRAHAGTMNGKTEWSKAEILEGACDRHGHAAPSVEGVSRKHGPPGRGSGWGACRAWRCGRSGRRGRRGRQRGGWG